MLVYKKLKSINTTLVDNRSKQIVTKQCNKKKSQKLLEITKAFGLVCKINGHVEGNIVACL